MEDLTLEGELLAAFGAVREALLSNNRNALECLLSRDYRGVTIYGHPEHRDTVIDMFGSGQVVLEAYEVKDIVVEVCDHIGVISGKGYIAGEYAGDLWHHHLRFCDVFAYRDDRWQLQFSHGTEIQAV